MLRHAQRDLDGSTSTMVADLSLSGKATNFTVQKSKAFLAQQEIPYRQYEFSPMISGIFFAFSNVGDPIPGTVHLGHMGPVSPSNSSFQGASHRLSLSVF